MAPIKVSENIAKSMAYISDQSGDDFQQTGCLYKTNQWHSVDSYLSIHECLTDLRNKPWQKQIHQLLACGGNQLVY